MIRAMTAEYHLDKPFLTQYWIWAEHALRLKFGNSIVAKLPVTEEFKLRLPTSLFLGLYAFVLAMLVGVGGGVIAALKRRTAIDRGIVGMSLIALSTPVFVSGVLLLYLFAIVVPVFPAFGKGSGFWDGLWHLTLPAISLALIAAAVILRYTRAALLSVLDQDYIVFARARGLSRRRVLVAYALRNALIPVVTASSVVLAGLITGQVLVETVFTLPGIGQLIVQSAQQEDVPMVQGLALFLAVAVIGANLLADLLYLVLDPRIRHARRA
jgi:peptide/nickel transport system permease protein